MSTDATEEFDREAIENGEILDEADVNLPYNKFAHVVPMIEMLQ